MKPLKGGGAAGTVKLAGYVTVIVSPPAAPLALVVRVGRPGRGATASDVLRR
jgi:hypothetical protein